ncbi:CysS/YqeB C-terminal domain-containing protein, partial [Bifidobacterium longum]
GVAVGGLRPPGGWAGRAYRGGAGGGGGGAADGTAESPEHAALEALIDEQLNARAEARKAKDFAKADQIRDALTEAGIAIEDGPQGSTWSLK